MPDAQYWNGYDRLLGQANQKYAAIEPEAGLYEVVGIVLELLNRTSDYRDAAEAAQAASVFMSGLRGMDKPSSDSPEADGEADRRVKYYPTEKDVKKGYV